jgi:hypothetical protein
MTMRICDTCAEGRTTLPARAVMAMLVASKGLQTASVISAFSGIFVSGGPERLPLWQRAIASISAL